MAQLNLGLVHALVGQKEEAIEVYRRCSQLDGAGLKDPRTHETTKISALFNLGRLYADTVMGMGGSKPAAQVFELFRGRGPTATALLRHDGLL